jgi:hypothetical protein
VSPALNRNIHVAKTSVRASWHHGWMVIRIKIAVQLNKWGPIVKASGATID